MPIIFRCTNCRRKMSTAAAHAGRKVRCPDCSTVVIVPAESEGEQPAPPPRRSQGADAPRSEVPFSAPVPPSQPAPPPADSGAPFDFGGPRAAGGGFDWGSTEEAAPRSTRLPKEWLRVRLGLMLVLWGAIGLRGCPPLAASERWQEAPIRACSCGASSAILACREDAPAPLPHRAGEMPAMNLTLCCQCQGTVARNAPYCPHCGAPRTGEPEELSPGSLLKQVRRMSTVRTNFPLFAGAVLGVLLVLGLNYVFTTAQSQFEFAWLAAELAAGALLGCFVGAMVRGKTG